MLLKNSNKVFFFQLQMVLRHSHHPPILQTNSRTLAAPFKEQRLSRTPSESIGNNYSPQAQDLNIIKLQQRRHTFCQSSAKPVGPCILLHFSSNGLHWVSPCETVIVMFCRLLSNNNFICYHNAVLETFLKIHLILMYLLVCTPSGKKQAVTKRRR